MKTEFIISVIVDSSFECFSNMPVDYIREMPDSQRSVTFQKTPPMSTYVSEMVVLPYSI